MSNSKTIHKVLRRGVRHLLASQLETGEFPSVISDRVDLQGWTAPDSCVFASAGVLHSLRYLGGSALEPLRARTVRFLRDEMVGPGIWSYWTRRSGKELPPDVDDTACLLSAIGSELPDGTVTAGRQAIIANRNEKGLFKTWILPENTDNHIDSVVNANVAAYLGNCPETRKARTYLCEVLQSSNVSDTYWYYAHDAALYYAISRAAIRLGDRAAAVLGARLAARLSEPLSTSPSPLEAALEACALLNIGIVGTAAVAERIRHILKTQRPDGSWAPFGYYAGPYAPQPRSVWFGSASLTTAICIEALSHYALETGLSPK